MCSIAGLYAPGGNLEKSKEKWSRILNQMNRTLGHRGPDDEGIYLADRCGLAHTRLAILDPAHGRQPMQAQRDGQEYCIAYNGETYNMPELRKELEERGIEFETTSDTEVVLKGYMTEGTGFFAKMNGIFAFAIWNETEKQLILVRDRLGVKPLFYAFWDGMLLFASEIKGILSFPGFPAEVDREGLCEVFALGPAKTPGKGVFRRIKELRGGCMLTLTPTGEKTEAYWRLQAAEHRENMQRTIEHTEWLLEDAVRMQMLSDIPISTFLSGGVDSSLVTAICAAELKKQGKQLNTFSFDFTENNKYFQKNAFQPSEDRPYAEMMAKYCDTNHFFLECSKDALADELYPAVRARDLPGMADVEGSMLYFCREVVKQNKVTLTGECADEIFGGYPWFHRKELLEKDGFPWSNEFSMRTAMLKDEVLAELHLKEYEREAYEISVAAAPLLPEWDGAEKKRQQIAWLNLNWFMVTLLDRMDRTSMACGLEARVPFADHRIVEYIYNTPWEMKCPDGMVKGLLRKAGEKYLPKEVLYRKKSPYPKTYHPGYEASLKARFTEILHEKNEPVHAILDEKKAEEFLMQPSDYAKPWYGQLMAGPQLYAYLLMVNYWLKQYRIKLV